MIEVFPGYQGWEGLGGLILLMDLASCHVL